MNRRLAHPRLERQRCLGEAVERREQEEAAGDLAERGGEGVHGGQRGHGGAAEAGQQGERGDPEEPHLARLHQERHQRAHQELT